MLDLVDRGIKAAFINMVKENMFQVLKKNMY